MIERGLDIAVNSALVALAAHPSCILAPIYRRKIYSALISDSDLGNSQAYEKLAILTARHVLPIWQTAWPHNRMPEHLLETAERIVFRLSDREVAKEQAIEASDFLGNFGKNLDPSFENAFFSGAAALRALEEILSKNPFDGALIDDDTTDSDLDPWCSDTALYAASAYAGPVWEKGSDTVKRREFWNWWLTDAIPTASQATTI